MASSFLEPANSPEPQPRNWVPFAVGGALVILTVAVIWLFARNSAPAGPAPPPPYAAQVHFGDIKMATAQNFMGATVTYLDGKVTNAGDKAVTQATVEVLFKNSLDQICQQERVALRVLEDRPGYEDPVNLAQSPLAPGQVRRFRLTFEHVSGDWNGQYPSLTLVNLTTR